MQKVCEPQGRGSFFPPIMGGKWNLEALFSLHFADPGGKIEGYFPPIFWTLGGKWDVVSPHLEVFPPIMGGISSRQPKI